MTDYDASGSSRHLSSDSYPQRSSSATCIPAPAASKERPRTSPSPASQHSHPAHASKVAFPLARSNNLYDKALPPLPDAAGSAPSLNQQLPANPSNLEVASYSSSTGFPSASKIRTFSTSALALAGSNPGVTPVMPSTSQLPSKVHDVTNDTQTYNNAAPPVLRKAKSSSKLNQKKLPEHDSGSKTPQSDKEYRRARGLSFGSPYLLNFSRDTKAKGKEKDIDASKTSLSRKGSFWSRRRQPTQNSEARTPVASILSSKSFPQLSGMRQPESPVIRSENSKQLHRRGLSRSLSERSFLSRPSRSVLENGRSPRSRPSSAHTPRTVNLSSPANSFFKPPWSRGSNDSGEKPRVRPRPRAQTNPPFLHRLSLNIFSFATSPPSPNCDNDPPNILIDSPSISKTKSPIVISPKHEETPCEYVQRLVSSIGKGEIAAVLASSAETFHTKYLQAYIDRFDFLNDPLDIAMRKLLMHVGLPRETQQIDRVIEAFGRRYLHCNPDLFIAADHPYILAFSLMMLHTDAFNKSNKRKMTKGDYVKNTKLPGVPVEVLECFYDNIVFAPFIFIEDPVDIDGRTNPDPSSRMIASVSSPSLTLNGNAGAFLKGAKIDPYYLIVNNSLAPLRIDVHLFIPQENPYSYEGTAGPWDIDQLQYDFAGATVLLLDGPNQWQDVAETYLVPYHPEEVDVPGCFPHVPTSLGTTCGLKIIKVGLLNKKEDISVGSKKATNRKWRPWTVVLTTSHLLFFRDLSLVPTLLPYLDSSHRRIKIPPSINFRPDVCLTISDSIAVHDQLYTKYNNVFRFAMSDGRQMLLQATFEKEMNDWMARINYASTFKTTQIRVRPPSMSGKMVELTGVAAAASHLQDIHHRRRSNPLYDLYTHIPSSDTLLDDDKPNMRTQSATPLPRCEDTDIPVAPEVEGADQMKATFDQVKADLAACLLASSDKPISRDDSIIARNTATTRNGALTGLPSRFHVTQSKVEDLQEQIAMTQSQLDSDMRVVRNIAQLTPFQKTTRDRLETALPSISKRIIESWINLTKLLCYHDTLCRDLSSEIRSWGEAKKMAFQAAQLTLQKHFDGLAKQPAPVAKSNNLSKDSQRRRSTSSSGQSSSACESFHSALDTKIDGGSLAPSSSNGPGGTSSPSLYNGGEREARNPATPSSGTSRNSSRVHNTPHNSEQEEAEVWDKTRCAQRVSLVRLPSTLQMARLRSLGE